MLSHEANVKKKAFLNFSRLVNSLEGPVSICDDLWPRFVKEKVAISRICIGLMAASISTHSTILYCIITISSE